MTFFKKLINSVKNVFASSEVIVKNTILINENKDEDESEEKEYRYDEDEEDFEYSQEIKEIKTKIDNKSLLFEEYSNKHYRIFLEKEFGFLADESIFISYKKLIWKLITLENHKERQDFLKQINNLNFLNIEQNTKNNFFVFENAQKEIVKIKNSKKIYFLNFVTLPLECCGDGYSLFPYGIWVQKMENNEITKEEWWVDPWDRVTENKIIEIFNNLMNYIGKTDCSIVVFDKLVFQKMLQQSKIFFKKRKIKYADYVEWINLLLNKKDFVFSFSDFFKYSSEPMLLFPSLNGKFDIELISQIIPEKYGERTWFKPFVDGFSCNTKEAFDYIDERIKNKEVKKKTNNSENKWDHVHPNINKWGLNVSRVMAAGVLYIFDIVLNTKNFYSDHEFIYRKSKLERDINN